MDKARWQINIRRTLRALRFAVFGGPEVLTIDDVDCPSPRENEVLVEVHAGGLNFADTERRRGLYLHAAPLPDISGFEGAGVVVGVGPGVDAAWLHRRVAFIAPRAHAEFCAVPVSKLLPLSDATSFVQGAAFPLQGLTAWHVLHTLGRVKMGEVVLVHSAAGGVGQWLVQLGQEVGATVIGSVSREGKAAHTTAKHVLTRGPHFREQLRAVAPEGVDVILEGLGAEAAESAPVCLKPFGRWVCYGTSSGPPPPLSIEALFEKSITLSAFWLRTPLPGALALQATEEVTSRIERGSVSMEVKVCPLEDAPRAHRRLEGALTTGKWVFRIRSTNEH